MPIALSFLYCVALGNRLERNRSTKEAAWASVWVHACIIQAFFLTPAWTAIYLASPAYAFIYRFDPYVYPILMRTGWATFVYNLGSLTILVCAIWATQKFRGHRWAFCVRLPAWTSLAVTCIVASLFWDRLTALGDYEAFWLREAPSIWRVPAAWGCWSGLTLAWFASTLDRARCKVSRPKP